MYQKGEMLEINTMFIWLLKQKYFKQIGSPKIRHKTNKTNKIVGKS